MEDTPNRTWGTDAARLWTEAEGWCWFFGALDHCCDDVREPEGNGIMERFLRTLKEQVLWVHRFRNLEEARQVIGEFIARYNGEWLIQRLGYRSPAQARESFLTLQEAA